MGNVKIIILHGWVYTTEKWQSFTQHLDSLQIAWEMPEIPGLTGKLEKPLFLEDYVDWLGELLSKKNEKIVLLGHSNGGRIALAYAAKHPQVLNRLVLLDSAGIKDKKIKAIIKTSLAKLIAKLGKTITRSEKIKKFFYSFIRERDYYEASPIMKETMKNLISVDLTEKLGLIKTPTTIIWGAKDRSTPLYQGKLMNDKIKNSKLFILPAANHSPQSIFYKEVIDIIKKQIES